MNNLIIYGFPFESIDENNFHLLHRFLTQIFTRFYENGQQGILVISILGLRHSGKCTLLQYIYIYV
jgi:predicted AAA+ superfamily ATPase